MQVEVVIIGAGLAGTVLAQSLMMRGKRVRLLDSPERPKASLTAAGILNPVTGKRLVKTWQADLLFPYARKYYRALEAQFGGNFFHEHPILRALPAGSALEARFLKRQTDPAFAAYLEAGISFPPALSGGLGADGSNAFMINGGGHLDLPVMLAACHAWFKEQGVLEECALDYQQLALDAAGGVRIGELRADKVIFCEGVASQRNPFFNWLPFEPAKGELLDVRIPNLHLPPALYQGAKWLLPLENETFRLGATYEHDDQTSIPTAAARASLLNELQSMLPRALFDKLVVSEQRAGIRPTTKDRQAFIGRHPEHKNLFIFGGFGSKGASLVPFLSNHLIDHIYAQQPLLAEVDCSRYAPS